MALPRKDVPFVWTPKCQEAFERLKELLTSPPVLAYPCFDRPFVLHTDASGQGLGAVLEQEQDNGLLHPVAYASRTISKHEARYGVTDLEALGVVWAAKHFRAYLWGHQCTVYTDHTPFRALLRAKHQSGKLARWAGLIAELNLDVQYRPGRANANASTSSEDCSSQLSEAALDGGTSSWTFRWPLCSQRVLPCASSALLVRWHVHRGDSVLPELPHLCCVPWHWSEGQATPATNPCRGTLQASGIGCVGDATD